MTLKQGDYSELSGLTQENHRGPYNLEEGAKSEDMWQMTEGSECCDVRVWLALAGFEDGCRGPWANK